MSKPDAEEQWVDVGAADLEEGELRYAQADGSPVLLVGRATGATAFQGTCSHDAYDLDDASFEDGRIVCSGHFSAFDPDTGDVLEDPARSGLVRYEVRESGGRLILRVPPGGLAAN